MKEFASYTEFCLSPGEIEEVHVPSDENDDSEAVHGAEEEENYDGSLKDDGFELEGQRHDPDFDDPPLRDQHQEIVNCLNFAKFSGRHEDWV